MMSIKLKTKECLETKGYWAKRTEQLKNQIKTDTTGAFWHVDETIAAMEKEATVRDEMVKDPSKPLAGAAVGVKDLFCVKGMKTTAGSKILDGFVAPYDSTVWKSVKDAGGFMAGKLAMDEFAMGSFTKTSYLGKTSVPGHLDRSAGGSSGGSAAAVASGIVDFSLGSDTGGSVRLPASFCGVVGYKPSYGAFSRFGMIPYASSLDQAGFFTRSMDDLQTVISSQLSFKDKQDMTSVGLGRYERSANKITRVGYFKNILESTDIQPEVAQAYEETLQDIEMSGVELVPIDIDFMDQAAQIYYIIACSEASSNLARYQGVYFGEKLSKEPLGESFADTISAYRSKFFGDEVQRRIMLGSFILSAENFTEMYEKSWNMRKALTASIHSVLESVDTIVLPVSPTVAPKWDDIDKMSPAQVYYSDYMTVPFSLAGVPALSVPWKQNNDGLHIGMQFVGKKFKDYELIDSVSRLEVETYGYYVKGKGVKS
jgi:aspartyl-tRNA(Asn)/glutamyl-tRNA(Gln) amidotransferase subunit A